VRVTATAGPVAAEADFPPGTVGRPTVVVTLHPAPPLPLPAAHAVTVDVARSLPHLKTTSYVAAHVAHTAAVARGADLALVVHDGQVLEAANGNVLVVTGRELATPPMDAGILAGVTRGAVLAVAMRAGSDLDVAERAIGVDELPRADAVLLCSSVVGLRDIARVDGEAVGIGRDDIDPAVRHVIERLRAALATDGAPATPGGSGPRE
jgi:branched-subunit amino acid aminotransferase/4-amino-4-deoxychorismate lyase